MFKAIVFCPDIQSPPYFWHTIPLLLFQDCVVPPNSTTNLTFFCVFEKPQEDITILILLQW